MPVTNQNGLDLGSSLLRAGRGNTPQRTRLRTRFQRVHDSYAAAQRSGKSLRQRYTFLYRILSGRSRMKSAAIFNRSLALLIVFCVIAFVLESIPSISSNSDAARAFYIFEAFSSCVFLVEYVARLWTCIESRQYRKLSPWRARFKYALSLRALVDLASCLPFFLELGGNDLPTLTWIKAFRMFRILKSERYTRAFSSVYRVVWYNSEILGVALFIGLLLMMTTSTMLWYLAPEHDNLGEEADDFSSIPATFYLSILMLTGQGTPSGNLPWYTKVIVMLTAVFSVPIFVIPSSMLTWGFEAEAERLMRKKREVRKKMKVAKRRGTTIESSSSSEDEYILESEDDQDAWDEYESVVLGEDDEGGKSEGSELTKEDLQLLRDVSDYFDKADNDADGTLTMLEFFEFARLQRGKNVSKDVASLENAQASQISKASVEHVEKRLSRVEEKLDKLIAAMERKGGME
eukprot:g3274.t1